VRSGRSVLSGERYRDLALALLEDERLDDVAALYAYMLTRDPARADFFRELTPAMREAAAIGPANQVLLLAGMHHNNDPEFLFSLAREHQALGNFTDAAGLFEDVLKLSPDHYPAAIHLGETLLEVDANDRAIEVLARAHEQLPENAHIANLLGIAYHRFGRYEEAIPLYQRAGELDRDESDYPLNEGLAWRDKGESYQAVEALERSLERAPDDPYLLQETGLLWLEHDLDRAIALFEKAGRIDPDDPYSFRLLGDALRRAEYFERAREAFLTAIDIDPGDHFSYNGIGLIFEARDQLDDAIESYRKAIELMPEEPVYFRNLGFRLMDTDSNEEALEILERALALEPDHALTHSILGQLYRDCDTPHKALHHLEQALRLDPGNLESRRELAYLLHDLREYEAAAEAYTQILHQEPKDAVTHFNMGQVLLVLDRLGDAERFLRNAQKLDRFCNIYPELGVALHRKGRLEEARTAFEEALLREPADDYALSGYALLLTEMGRLEEAAAYHQQAIELAPREPQHFHNLADLFFDQGLHAEAEEAYHQALAIDPDRAATWNGLGVVLEHLNRLEEAAEHYGRAAELAPGDALPFANLGSILYQLEQDGEAIEAFRRAIEIDDRQAGAYNGLGAVQLRSGDPEAAVEAFRNAVRIQGYDYRYHHNLGMALFRTGDEREAMRSLQTAVTLYPEDCEAWKTMGLIFLGRGEDDRAYTNLERAHAIDSQDPETRFALWDIYQNKRRAGESAYTHAASLRGNDPEAAPYRAAFAQSALVTGRYEEAVREAQGLLTTLTIDAPTRELMGLVLTLSQLCLGRLTEATRDYETYLAVLEGKTASPAWETAGLRDFLERCDIPETWRTKLATHLNLLEQA